MPEEQKKTRREIEVETVTQMRDAIRHNFAGMPSHMVLAACGSVVAEIIAETSPLMVQGKKRAKQFGEDMAANIQRNWPQIELERATRPKVVNGGGHDAPTG
jgi:hypothetical protein